MVYLCTDIRETERYIANRRCSFKLRPVKLPPHVIIFSAPRNDVWHSAGRSALFATRRGLHGRLSLSECLIYELDRGSRQHTLPSLLNSHLFSATEALGAWPVHKASQSSKFFPRFLRVTEPASILSAQTLAHHAPSSLMHPSFFVHL